MSNTNDSPPAEGRSRRDTLERVARFLERRGGIGGYSQAVIKGILCSLPFVGKTIEELIYNAAETPIAEQVGTAIERYSHEIQQTDDPHLTAGHFLDLADAVLIIAKIDDADRETLLGTMVDQLAEIESTMERLEAMQADTQEDVGEILAILKEHPLSDQDRDALVRKAVAIFTLNRLLLRVRDVWPPQPFLSRTPDTCACVRETISVLRDLLRQAHTVAEFLWDDSDHHVFREYLERSVDVALQRYEETQDSFEDWDFVKTVELLKGTPESESVYAVIPLWIGCLETISAAAQNQIIEALKGTTQE